MRGEAMRGEAMRGYATRCDADVQSKRRLRVLRSEVAVLGACERLQLRIASRSPASHQPVSTHQRCAVSGRLRPSDTVIIVSRGRAAAEAEDRLSTEGGNDFTRRCVTSFSRRLDSRDERPAFPLNFFILFSILSCLHPATGHLHRSRCLLQHSLAAATPLLVTRKPTPCRARNCPAVQLR